MQTRPALIIMMKAPRTFQVKTRLCPPLSPGEAASLATAFLKDAVTQRLGLGFAVFVAYAPADGREELEALLPSGLLWTPQQGMDLGARMLSAMQAISVQGYGPLVMIGTDSPTLPASCLDDAFELLATDTAEVVLGPSDDGGYYLIGLRRPIADLFDAVAWSTERTLADTLRNAEASGLRVSLLLPWYDVDTPDDLRRLWEELESSPMAQKYAPHTARWIREHEDFYNHTYVE